MKKCVIIGAVPITDDSVLKEISSGDYVICADGGVDTALTYKIKPDLIIGDFDSVKNELPQNIETIRLKTEKDDTDMMAAVKQGLSRGYRDFVLLGALGGQRFDHSFANLCTLQYLCQNGCKALILDENCRVFLLKGGRLTLGKMKGKTVSVFPFGCVSCKVSYIGLKYPLTNAMLTSENPLGTSNQVVCDLAQITVHNGSALIVVL